MPKTSTLVGTAIAVLAPLIGLLTALNAVHWTDPQIAGVSGFTLASVGILGFVIEHFRHGVPSRWVGVITLVPAWLVALVVLGNLFSWWPELNRVEIEAYVIAIFAPIGSLFGVKLAQAKVWSPETKQAEENRAVTAAVLEGGTLIGSEHTEDRSPQDPA